MDHEDLVCFATGYSMIETKWEELGEGLDHEDHTVSP